MADVISPSDIGITFNDIGALENVKNTLRELIMLPLQRPELFSKGQLTKVVLYLWTMYIFSILSLINIECNYFEFSHAREYYFLVPLALGKQCWQRP